MLSGGTLLSGIIHDTTWLNASCSETNRKGYVYTLSSRNLISHKLNFDPYSELEFLPYTFFLGFSNFSPSFPLVLWLRVWND